MTALELLKTEIDAVGSQLDRCLTGIPADKADFRLAAHSQSLRDLVAHHCEVYQAVLTKLAGGEHNWGTYTPPTTEWDPLVALMGEMRADAVEGVLVDDDAKLSAGADFIVAHDNYHVGQLVITRLAIDPTWDPYSIYSH